MKTRILFGFGLIVFIFLGGSIIAVSSITKTIHRMDKMIMLHQVEILREGLIIRVQEVQSRLYRNKTRNDGDADALIAQVQEMDQVMDACVGCHHSPELAQGILGMRDLANDYKTAISRLVSASATNPNIGHMERRAQDLGQELITMVQGMALTANLQLQQTTQDTMASIWEVRNVLYLTFLLCFLVVLIIAYFLTKGLDLRIQKLIEATRRISQGELQHQVDLVGGPGSKFNELGEAFNAMTRNLLLSQRQMVQSAKLSAIGELGTNIAYEVNNPLTGVLGHVGLLLKSEEIPADKKNYLKAIEQETHRARKILEQLLHFSRRRPPQLVQSEISSVVQGAISPVKDSARLGNVEIVADCPAGLPLVAIDGDEMKQVFANLINNAVVAMPMGGVLTIRCGDGADLAGNKVVTVEFIDTGHGIPEEQLEKIFDPFFTTRPDGEGTGLGLSISYMIVQNHNGRLEVESKIGVGSTFRVVLPV